MVQEPQHITMRLYPISRSKLGPNSEDLEFIYNGWISTRPLGVPTKPDVPVSGNYNIGIVFQLCVFNDLVTRQTRTHSVAMCKRKDPIVKGTIECNV